MGWREAAEAILQTRAVLLQCCACSHQPAASVLQCTYILEAKSTDVHRTPFIENDGRLGTLCNGGKQCGIVAHPHAVDLHHCRARLFTYRSMAACSHSFVLPTDTTLTRRPRLICSGATRDACVGLCTRCGANINATTTSEARSRRWTMAERIVSSLPRLHQSITRSSLFTKTDSSLFNAGSTWTPTRSTTLYTFTFPRSTPPGTTDCCGRQRLRTGYTTNWLAHALVRLISNRVAFCRTRYIYSYL